MKKKPGLTVRSEKRVRFSDCIYPCCFRVNRLDEADGGRGSKGADWQGELSPFALPNITEENDTQGDVPRSYRNSKRGIVPKYGKVWSCYISRRTNIAMLVVAISARQFKNNLAAVLGWISKVQLTTKIILSWNFDPISAPKPALKISFLTIFRLSPRFYYYNNTAIKSIMRFLRTFPFDYN